MFKDDNDFSLYIEKLKEEHGFETYTETVAHFYENETDHEMSTIVKMLNKKIIGEIQFESEQRGLLKNSTVRLI